MGLPDGPELPVIGPVSLAVPFVLAYWASNDAESRGDDRAAFRALVVYVRQR
jgi:hypothetical protein